MSENRTLTDHVVFGDTVPQLSIEVSDEPGAGGANHRYRLSGFSGPGGLAFTGGDVEVHPDGSATTVFCDISFQNGPIKEAGVSGVTQEALLTIVIDRLRSFQAGPFSCRENAIALTHCEDALMWLQRRTIARIKRGVEGTNQK